MAPTMSERLIRKYTLNTSKNGINMGIKIMSICTLFQKFRYVIKNPDMIFVPDFYKRNTFV